LLWMYWSSMARSFFENEPPALGMSPSLRRTRVMRRRMPVRATEYIFVRRRKGATGARARHWSDCDGERDAAEGTGR